MARDARSRRKRDRSVQASTLGSGLAAGYEMGAKVGVEKNDDGVQTENAEKQAG
jgi:hypothetical protein